LGNNKKAIFYYQKAHQLLADSSSAHSLAISHLKNDSPEKSLYYFNYMKNKLKLEIGSEGVELITPILELQKELQKEEDNIKILIKIAEKYQEINLIDNAQKYLAKANELKEQKK
jgi:tetratricopeptide (TPR) repeat protein